MIYIQMILGFMFGWSTAVVLAGLLVELVRRAAGRAEKRKDGPAGTNFACIICAHNEERVIARPIASILAARYPESLREIFVFADNCADGTASIARSFPGVRVMEKSVPSKGKGDVLAWGIDQIRGECHDAIAVFDADNEVDPEWFLRMDEALRSGAHVATGRRMSSNPFDNLITGWYSLYWNLMNELSNRVRSTLHLSAMLTGTGFCFKKSVLPAEGWRTRTFVEDLEFALFRNLDGYRMHYISDAVFYDEQPTSVRPMLRQLNRWATGGLQILCLYSWTWFKSLLRRPSFRLFDSLAIVSLGAFGSLLMLVNAIELNWRFGIWFAALAWTSAVLSTALSRHSIRSLLLPIVTFPLFVVVLSCTVLYSMVHPQRRWKPIEHGRQCAAPPA